MPVTKPWKPLPKDQLVEMLGADSEWLLWYRSTVNGWHNFALQPPDRLRKTKSVFHGAWNGERLCGNYELGLLAERHLEIYVELKNRCPTIEWEFDE